jgi:crotonobetainyl-CoA:carnitine CoA-transferase CaiB-like acyl-CoA transferase
MLLKGLKVVEYATYIAAPGAGMMMADWGAEVIKVEPPGGDPIRGFFDTIGTDMAANPVFELDNRGKRSIILDTATEAGRGALLKLADQADVFLTNVRPGGLERAGLDYATLSARNPRLVYASVTGYGLEGPEVDRAGFDIASFWSRSGWARLTAPKGVDPFPIRTGVGDHVCSLATVAGIMAALVERGTTGRGRLVDASLMRTGTYTLGSDLAIQMRFGRIASTRPREEALNPLANFFQCADGRWICLVPRQGSKDWKATCEALGLGSLVEDERFAGSGARRRNGPALVRLFDAAFGGFTFEEAARRLDSADVAWAPVQSLAEVVADPQFQASGGQVQVPDGKGGSFAAPGGPLQFPGAFIGPAGPPPAPGEHGAAILAELGYGPGEIAAILTAGS